MKKYYMFLLCCLAFNLLHATNYYVNASTGNDNINTGLSTGQAFQTIAKAVGKTNAGDTVFIMAGDYSPFAINRPGNSTATGSIVYINYPGSTPRIISTSSTGSVITVSPGANYVKVIGLEVVGYGVHLSLAADTIPAQAAVVCPTPGDSATSTTFISKYNGHGINVSGSSTVTTHHVVIKGCKIHDCAAGGIGVGYSDYISIDRNTIYNNCWYTPYGESGISFGSTSNYDANTTTYRNVISNNICYRNRLYVLWHSQCTISDGNGIILDVPLSSYTGKQLVVNNICFNNGGSGIHALSNNNVDFINNTVYMNGASPTNTSSSLYASGSASPSFYNNIIVAKDTKLVNQCKNSTNVVYDYNLYYGGSSIDYIGVHSLIQDPKFLTADTNATVANFHLQQGSFAVNNGTNAYDNVSAAKYDRDNFTRPIASVVDIGAYESNYSGNLNTYGTTPTTVQLAPGTGGGAGNSNLYGPYVVSSTNYQQSRFAFIYPQALLSNYGVPSSCQLTSLQFNKFTAAQAAPPNSAVRVYLRNEPRNNFGAANFDWATILPNATDPAVLVYGGDAANLISSASGWQTINFQVPFTYTGNHLGVYIEYLQNGNIPSSQSIAWNYDNSTSNGSFYSDPAQANSVKYVFASGSAATISNTLSNSNVRHPVMKMGYLTGNSNMAVRLQQFNAIKKGNEIYLNYLVSNESNPGFQVQRSADGVNFSNVGFLQSQAIANGSGSVGYYDFTDANPLKGTSYYRLVENETNGKQHISSVVAVSSLEKELNLLSIYPNPASNKLTALVNVASAGHKASISLQDLSGRILNKFQKQLPEGYSNIEMNVSKLASSFYLLVIEMSNGEKVVKKFMKE